MCVRCPTEIVLFGLQARSSYGRNPSLVRCVVHARLFDYYSPLPQSLRSCQYVAGVGTESIEALATQLTTRESAVFQLALFAGWREVRNRSAAAIHTELPRIPILCCRGLGVGSSCWVAPGPKGSTPSGIATVTRRVNCAHILTKVGDRRGAQPFLRGPADLPLTTNSDYLGNSPPLAPPRGHRAQVHGHLGT